jgi:hypothetical protein
VFFEKEFCSSAATTDIVSSAVSIDVVASSTVSIDFIAISTNVAISHDEEGVVLPRG